MNTKITRIRIEKQALDIEKDPIDGVLVARQDYFKFHFCFYNMEREFQNGFYHGVLQLDENYPFAPPKIMFFTPNGRFGCQVYICTTFTHYHKQSWSPAWTIKNLLVATISFMYSKEIGIGCLFENPSRVKSLASRSLTENFKNQKFVEYFKHKLETLNLVPPAKINTLMAKFAKTQQKERLDIKLAAEKKLALEKKALEQLTTQLTPIKNDSESEQNIKKQAKNIGLEEQDEQIVLLQMMKKKRKTETPDQKFQQKISP